MLECRCCDVSSLYCDFKRDIFKALNLIDGYVPSRVVSEIEEIIAASVDKCPDFTPREELGNE
jgi:hypothetical protein